MERTPEDSEVYLAGGGLKRAAFAVDIDSGELALMKQSGFDVAIAHHPCGGSTWAGFPTVLERHAPIMIRAGVQEDRAWEAVRALQDEHGPRTHLLNYDRLPSVARLLRLPFMNIHAPADEIGRRVMHETIEGGVGPDPGQQSPDEQSRAFPARPRRSRREPREALGSVAILQRLDRAGRYGAR